MIDDEIKKIADSLDFESGMLQRCSNGLLLTNYEIQVLEKYNINYNSVSSLKEIIFLVEDILSDDSTLDDLENISQSIAERDYYMNTNK